jgi:hypothetical protein
MKISAPTAFLLVKFKGSPNEPMTKAAAERMFTAAGNGTMNVVDWFDDNCHGNVNMQGNAVFGWLSLSDTLADYNAKRADGSYARTAIIDLARAAAAAAKVDLSKFAIVVAVTNEGVDLFGGSGFACCNAVTAGVPFWAVQVAPSVLCQEMIHGMGVYEHTRRHGSDDDYTDPYDVMSMFAAWPGQHPNNPNLPVGPGLNAAFMQRCGWLDPTRGTTGGLGVNLRPLHRRDLPGPLYAFVGGTYYVEYRPSRRWDTGFASVVLVHYIRNNTSYLAAELRAGSPAFTWGDPKTPFEAYGSITVDAIDDRSETATISTFFRPARPIPSAGPAFSLFASELAGGAGIAIVGGKIVKIPPNSPALGLLEAAAAVVNAEALEIAPAVQTMARAQIYAQALETIEEAHEHITGVSSVLDHITMDEARAFHKRRRTGPRKALEGRRGRAAKTRRRASG